MAELIPGLSLVLGYWESSVVGPVYNRYHQGFQHCDPVGVLDVDDGKFTAQCPFLSVIACDFRK